MEEKETIDENQEEIGHCRNSASYRGVWSAVVYAETAWLNGCLWTRCNCSIGQYRRRRKRLSLSVQVLGHAMTSYGWCL